MVNASIIRPHIVIVEKEAFLYYERDISKGTSSGGNKTARGLGMIERNKGESCGLHRLKLVTGVDISTRPVNKSGSPGRPWKRSNRNKAAPA